MKVEHGNHICEHCGASVPLAKVCPCCGREHSDEWISDSEHTDVIVGLTSLPVGLYIIYNLFSPGIIHLLLNFEDFEDFVKTCLYITVITFIIVLSLFGIKPKISK